VSVETKTIKYSHWKPKY